MKQFTIVIPTHNRSAQLSHCIDSILAQTHSTVPDIIIIDDGSNRTHAQCNEEYCKKNKIHYIQLLQSNGPAHARNLGINHSTTQWIVFLDDDVIVGASWIDLLTNTLSRCPPSCIGVEGRVVPSGEGLWDREVQNLSGGGFLSCHIAYRRDILLLENGFDTQFKGPFCEDHELAARMLCHGEITFAPEIHVVHQPRMISPINFLLYSRKRINLLLESEYRFFTKHPDRYHSFRKSRTFSGTLISLILLSMYQEFRRRTQKQIVDNIPDTLILLISTLFEQLYALFWTIGHFSLLSKRRSSFFSNTVDIQRTADLWEIGTFNTDFFKIRRSVLNAATYRYLKRPVYNSYFSHKQITRTSQTLSPQVFIRIDDLFFNDIEVIRLFMSHLKKLNIPIMAAIRGSDIQNKKYHSILDELKNNSVFIGIHGFTHEGKYGPFDSELLQMKYSAFEEQYCQVVATLTMFKQNHSILVPPFNAICRSQIIRWSKISSIICGGPETARFTDQFYGPVALSDGGWYFPCMFPFYGNAAMMLQQGVPSLIGKLKGPLCLTMHFTQESKDQFRSFTDLLEMIRSYIHNWEETQTW
jgi:glycosyltransferase involved in cell wall biosynthesis